MLSEDGCASPMSLLLANKLSAWLLQMQAARLTFKACFKFFYYAVLNTKFTPEMSLEDRNATEDMMADHGMEVETVPYKAPPGDEALDLSHAGGEHEAFEGLAHQMADLSGWYVFTGFLLQTTMLNHSYSQYVDPRTRRE
jgi:hypothetical protein